MWMLITILGCTGIGLEPLAVDTGWMVDDCAVLDASLDECGGAPAAAAISDCIDSYHSSGVMSDFCADGLGQFADCTGNSRDQVFFSLLESCM